MSTRLTTPGEILKTALEQETGARDFYADLARHTAPEFVKELLYKLQNEESKHMKMIQKMLARLENGREPL